ncbi:MAG: heme lyase CcmF/NrfE family subunit [Thermodesulfobacteriota bacterium]|nr:heme lyase CcmF/NrfE family subunit [Thermodesulfobacteriota bacterium]
MIEVGSYSLFIALFLAGYSILSSITGIKRQRGDVIASSENAAVAAFGFLSLASAAMLYVLATNNFSVEYVARYTNRSLPMIYTLTAFYAGQEGSLLLWAWVLSFYSVLVIFQNRKKNREIMPYVLSVLMLITFFFVFLIVFVTDPFKTLSAVPPDGHGLNPLLQNPGMIFHPPTLFLGYVGFSVPFAFAIGALITNKLGNIWIRTTRRWTIVSWLFMTAGNLLGAQWAYVELGWGGYWAWDPVENASFLPWLTATAFLHSVMIQEKRGMLKVWNMVLIISTFLLTIFGTFITRSGIIASVHSFGQSSLGWFFLGLLILVSTASFILILSRLNGLKSKNQLDSLFSRESSFLCNNLLIVGIAFAVLWGTLFPIISQAVRGVKITVGPPFFNTVVVPIALVLLLLIGICPFAGWRKTSIKKFSGRVLLPVILAAAGGCVLYALGIRQSYALLTLTLCLFVLITIIMEFFNGTKIRHSITGEGYPKAFWNLMKGNKRRYGGYIIHTGIVFAFVAISGNVFNAEEQISLKKGETFNLSGYTLRYDGLSNFSTDNKQTVAATVTLFNAGHQVGVLIPEKSLYRGQNQPTSDVAIHTTLKEDLYLILAGWDKDQASFKVLLNPLVIWLWIGGGVMAFGTIIVLLPEGRKKRKL